MKLLNCEKIKVMLVGVVAAIVLCSSQATIADFVICDPMPVDEAINSPDTSNVQGCSFLHDGLKLYFSARRGDKADGHTREIWVSERESLDAPWGEAVNLGSNINGPGGIEIEPTISPDNLELYFWRSGAWQSTRASKDEPWGPATPYTGIYPDDFSPDGLTMYTWGSWDGGYGGDDIWMATRATIDDDWGELVNLGPNVNDSADQFSSSISNDGLALFFNTWQPWRIWMSVRATIEDEWGPAVQLGSEVNGYGWVAFPEISPDGSTLYFDTDSRSGYPELFWQVSIKPIVNFNGDGIVDSADMCIMVDHWGENYSLCDIGPMPWGDGVVDIEDLKVFIKYWEQENLENPENVQ